MPDGTVVGLSEGTAVITASLAPANVTTASLTDGTFTKVDTRFKLPADMILKRSVTVSVIDVRNDSDDLTPTPTATPTSVVTPSPASSRQEDKRGVVLHVTPVIEGETSVLRPKLDAITQALQQTNENTAEMLVFTAPEGQRTENTNLILSSGMINAICNSGAAGIAFETASGSMVLNSETLAILQQLVGQSGEEQELTIGIRRVGVQEIRTGSEK